MSRICDICGKGIQFGSQISHAHNVSHRTWNPNLQRVRAIVDGKPVRLRVCTGCLRSDRVQKQDRKVKSVEERGSVGA
ncbi:MAG: 50S ribosomal protein L28 [Candidatus Eisenbacteria bacterium]|nr:50S ribosomal protein L28 [Candidatus Eisenbacteria bacterium]